MFQLQKITDVNKSLSKISSFVGTLLRNINVHVLKHVIQYSTSAKDSTLQTSVTISRNSEHPRQLY